MTIGVLLLPDFSRRGFMKVLGAVGLTPLLPAIPAIPARAAMASGGVSASKALWASLYANAGSAGEFVNVARNMGLSNAAIQGVSARTIGVRMAVAASSETLASASARTAHAPLSSKGGELPVREKVKHTLENYFSTETDDKPAVAKQKIENLAEETEKDSQADP